MKNKNTLVLLNSEGPILTAIKSYITEYTGHGMKTQDGFIIKDQFGKQVAFLSEKEIFDFTRGKLEILDSKSRIWKYTSQPGSMKPDLKKLYEFIGVDTTNKTY